MGLHHGQANFVTYGKPSLFLDFANKKSLTDRISGNNLITFTRSSTGTYVGADGLIKYAGADEARFDHDSSTGESLGLLIEESRTNLYDNTINFGSSNWILQTSPEVTLNTTDVSSPDGTYSAVKWTPTTTLSQYVYDSVGSLGSSLTYTMSVWVRTPEGESTTFQMNLYSPTQQSPVLTATDTWKRFTWTFTPQNQASAYPVIVRELNKSLYIWGPQIEVGSFPTSYITTSGSTVTRQPDNAQITGTNFTDFYNSASSTIYMEARLNSPGTLGQCPMMSFEVESNNNRNNSFAISRRSGQGVRALNYNSIGIEDMDITSSPWGDGSFKKFAYALDNSGSSAALTDNGTLVGTNSSYVTSSLSSVDILRIGAHNSGGFSPFNGIIKKLIYYPERLTNSQLQNLTK